MAEQPDQKQTTPPPKPLTPFAQAQLTLTEGFPTVEPNVIRAVLIASKGDLESAFNGLLSLTDSNYVVDESPFNNPNPAASIREDVQVRNDEKLARRLAAAVNTDAKRSTARNSNSPSDPVNDRSFFDEDLPQLKENFTKGFNETKDKVNTWLENFRKKEATGGMFGSVGGFLGGNNAGQSQQQQRQKKIYDDEPEHIDISGIRLSTDNDETRPALPSRPESTGKSATASESKPDAPGTPSAGKISLKADKPVDDESFLVSDSDDEEESDKKAKK
ncbi:hypothetical protein D0Z00_004227 [Geotrichum galactomycetum]|uniref:Uncharacterized protein n=1 Tax=Geotrichum galactomycetum TaxID=27317 RepID=A0ACB6UZ57_9ASCO|nr:hypothetical protein D0Z00_004227 [Geotrichum candidum]